MRNRIFLILVALMTVLSTQARIPRITKVKVPEVPKTLTTITRISSAERQGKEALRRISRNLPGVPGNVNTGFSHSKYINSLHNQCKRFKAKVQRKNPSLNSTITGIVLPDYTSWMDEYIMKRVMSGMIDSLPEQLIKQADIAMKDGDSVLVERCLERALQNLSPAQLTAIPSTYPSLEEYMPALIQTMVTRDYINMLDGKQQEESADTSAIKEGELMLLLSDKYLPALRPLTAISYVPAYRDAAHYRCAADSLMSNDMGWTPCFEQRFYGDMLATLYDAGEYEEALRCFGNEPAKLYADSIVDFQLKLCSCAVFSHDNDRYNYYFKKASENDTATTQAYFDMLYQHCMNRFLENPTQKELGDWLIDNTITPLSSAYLISRSLLKRYLHTGESWSWDERFPINQTQQEIRNASLGLLDKANAVDNGRATAGDSISAEYLRFIMTASDVQPHNAVIEYLESLDRRMAANPSDNINNLRCQVAIAMAFYSGHGIDSPKKGLKILKKNIQLLEAPGVSHYTKSAYYGYMEALFTALGKKKEAAEYHILQQGIQ